MKCGNITYYVRQGSEGPKHDPYSYMEVHTKTIGGNDIVLHMGLVEWLSINDRKCMLTKEEKPAELFTKLVGVGPDELTSHWEENYDEER